MKEKVSEEVQGHYMYLSMCYSARLFNPLQVRQEKQSLLIHFHRFYFFILSSISFICSVSCYLLQ